MNYPIFTGVATICEATIDKKRKKSEPSIQIQSERAGGWAGSTIKGSKRVKDKNDFSG